MYGLKPGLLWRDLDIFCSPKHTIIFAKQPLPLALNELPTAPCEEELDDVSLRFVIKSLSYTYDPRSAAEYSSRILNLQGLSESILSVRTTIKGYVPPGAVGGL